MTSTTIGYDKMTLTTLMRFSRSDFFWTVHSNVCLTQFTNSFLVIRIKVQNLYLKPNSVPFTYFAHSKCYE